MPDATPLSELDTPRLLLDSDRLERNCAAMRARCQALGVQLRPHLKTAKSLDVARVATDGAASPVTVSTLREAEHFAGGGYRDLLYAVGMTPSKLARVARIERETGARVTLVTDSETVVAAAERFGREEGLRFSFAVEVDSGEHRSGVAGGESRIVGLAAAIHRSPHLTFRGVMTHAGHSYATDDREELRAIAGRERDVIVGAAEAVRAAGIPCEMVSLGSTPTVLHAEHLSGVTEARCGVYMFWDLAQLSRQVCAEGDLALSVLATVIGHNRELGHLVLDAGALALSKDVSANRFMPGAGYGYLCDPVTLARLGDLAVEVVHQEHGTVPVRDLVWFERLPVGSLVRVLPNHACITAAAYDSYDVVRAGAVVGRWHRVNGW